MEEREQLIEECGENNGSKNSGAADVSEAWFLYYVYDTVQTEDRIYCSNENKKQKYLKAPAKANKTNKCQNEDYRENVN
ncbi:hypothetical protein NECAME_11446 [Necator americanus]|uniref:Uncharacterized protein n=1 Tax=Necator americanus TaxID=51031 RepID=W2T728_NECAM|nr:hypothetical protein NECAME_11446 [Necator americanus]ETN76782.1 hypothetical protein NECAME_11446 [Necator americanus]